MYQTEIFLCHFFSVFLGLGIFLKYEQDRTEELAEFEKYTKTKKYAEEMAKKKLGLVHDNEIIFKSSDGK